MLRLHRYLLTFVLALGLCSVPAMAQTSAPVDAARVKGMEYLQGEQYDDGSWTLEGHDVGITALCALALLENGVPATDETIEKAERFIKKERDEIRETCDISLSILFLARVGGRDARADIRELAARLIAGQNVEGGWGTTCPLASVGILSSETDRPRPQPGTGDNVCTQYAVQALWVSSQWGVDIRQTMALVSERFAETQRDDGGWPIVCEEWTKQLPPEEQKKRESQNAAADKKEAESKLATKKKATPVRKKSRGKPANKAEEEDAPAALSLGNKGVFGGNDGLENTPSPVFNSGPKEYQPSDPAMTFAALYALAVTKAAEIQQDQIKQEHNKKGAPPKTNVESSTTNAEQALLDDPTFADGLKKAVEYATKIKPSSACHFLWSVERLGVALGQDKFADVEWFKLGASALVKSQAENGSWSTSGGSKAEKSDEESVNRSSAETTYGLTGELADTAFAVLFLRQAQLGSEISRLLQGEQTEPFQIVSQTEKPRFKTLEEALKVAQQGDRIRIQGSGPFLLSHLDIDRDLTLEAGFGYQPVLHYDVGFDPDGRRSRPQDNPETLHMLRVTQGTLTLEGLDFQMDPPELGAKVLWTAIVAKGGTLRMLNCSVSEANKQGVAPIQVAGPGQVTLQNCQLIGGRAGVEILATGEQQIQLNNCIVFTPIGFRIQSKEPAEGGKCHLSLTRCVVQTQDVFNCQDLRSPLELECHGVAFQTEWMGQSMLASATGHDGITWKGSDNLYDVKRWVGHAAKSVSSVKDAKSWSTFWGGNDLNGTAKAIPFAARKTIGAFSHTVKGEDYEFAPTSPIHSMRRKTGIVPLNIGPGPGFIRYRDSIDYRSWAPQTTTAAAPAADPAGQEDAKPAAPASESPPRKTKKSDKEEKPEKPETPKSRKKSDD